MGYTVGLFRAEEHDPTLFLGRRIGLPELEGYPPALRQAMENPVLSIDDAQRWFDTHHFFAVGYDTKLDQAHWGVFTARTLEVAAWRMWDMAQAPEDRRWPGPGEDGSLWSEILVASESGATYNLRRDLCVFAQPRTGPGDDQIELPYPPIANPDPLLAQSQGNRSVEEFFSPLSPSLLVNALSAWEATRFTNRKDEQGRPRRFRIDLDLWRSKGPDAVFGALFGPSCVAGLAAYRLNQGVQGACGADERRPPRL